MHNNKAIAERIADDYKPNYKSVFIERATSNTLDELLNTCDSTKHMEEQVEWYDDENNPEQNTWIDVEGEGYGWLWVGKPEAEWHAILRNHLIDFIENKKSKLDEMNEYVVKVSNDEITIYHFVQREHSDCDTIYKFSKSEIHY